MLNNIENPLVLVVLDGFGSSLEHEFNAVSKAHTPNLDELLSKNPPCKTYTRTLLAHGQSVGLSTDDEMGNSEVGHNVLGAGRVFPQGSKLVKDSIESGALWAQTWQDLVRESLDATLHVVTLLSDGNTHSHIDHLKAVLGKAVSDGVKRIRLHLLFDGRDVPDRTAALYLKDIENFIDSLHTTDRDLSVLVASGGGRMRVTMDRYGASWPTVQRGFDAHVSGKGRSFNSTSEALETMYKETNGISDQDLEAFVIADDKGPVGNMNNGDVVLLSNFRGDRMMQFYSSLTSDDFEHFDVSSRPSLSVYGMMLWDGDLGIPAKYLLSPAPVSDTVSEVISIAGLAQFAVAETQKFGHITYFWNGNRAQPFNDSLEEYKEVPSLEDLKAHPQMSTSDTLAALFAALSSKRFSFLRANFAAGDMIGHTGDMEAAVKAVEALDAAIGLLVKFAVYANFTVIITADHGNCEEMVLRDEKGSPLVNSEGTFVSKNSHTTSPVPFIVIDPLSRNLKLSADPSLGLSSVAASLCSLLGVKAPDSYDSPVISINYV